MRTATATLIVATGIVSGLIGAVAVGHFQSSSRPPLSPATVEPPRAMIVPPGWDPRMLDRMSRVERRMDDLQARTSSATTRNAPTGVQDQAERQHDREQGRREHYDQELAYHSQFLADHTREALDPDWAATEEHNIERVVADVGVPLASVDCRSKTCVATMEFQTPRDALVYIQQSHSFPVEGCPAVSVIPTPPKTDGPYQLSVLFNCR